MKFTTVSTPATTLLLAALTPGVAANLFSNGNGNGNAGGNGNGNGSTPKRDVSLTLSTQKSSYASNEPVLIDVTLKNNESNKPAKILDWVIPCTTDATPPTSTSANGKELPTEMSMFDIHSSLSKRTATYLGAVFKRTKPADKDYKILKAGEEISCTVNLSEYYAFDDKKEKGYEISYFVDGMQLSEPGNSNGNGNAYGLQMENVRSNTLNVQIDARPAPAVGPPPAPSGRSLRGLQSGSTIFNGCSTTRQAVLLEARSIALTESTEVVNLLTSVGNSQSSASCPRYEEWFSSYNPTRHSELQDGYLKIQNDLDDKLINFDCTCTDSYFAYVYPNSPYNIYMCNAFWSAGMEGYNSKMGTVIHEISHFNIVAGTDDHAYGASACKTLANNEPNKAINNADNHEYMAENTPNLSCDAGPPTTSSPTSSPTATAPCPAGEARLEIDLLTDRYPEESSYTLTNVCTDDVTLSKSGFANKETMYKENLCVPDDEYDFTINDTPYSDGICCGYGSGSYKVTYKGVEMVSGGDFGGSETTNFGACSNGPPEPTNAPSKKPSSAPTSTPSKMPTSSPVTQSPTDSPTKNPTDAPSKTPTDSPTKSPSTDSPTKNPTNSPTSKPVATQSPTLTPTKNPTNSPSKSPTDSPVTPNPTKSPTDNGCDGMSITVNMLTDDYPGETSWSLVNTCTGVTQEVANPGRYTQAATPYSDTFCLPEAQYTFQIEDSANDGICCGRWGDGNYEVTSEGVTVASGGEFGSSETSSPFGACPVTPGIIVATHDAALGAPKCSDIGTSCTSGNTLKGRGSRGPETNTPNTIDSCTDGNSGSYRGDESLEQISVTALGGGELQAGGTAEIEAVVWAWNTGSDDTADFYYTADVNNPNWELIGSKQPEGGDEQSIKVQYQLPTSSALQAVRVNFRYAGSQSSCSGGSYDDADDLIFSVAVGGSVPSAKLPAAVPDLKPLDMDCEALGKDKDRCAAASAMCYWQQTGRDRGCHNQK